MELDADVVLVLGTDAMLALLRVYVVKAMKKPLEITVLEDRLGEVLGIEDMVEVLLEVEEGMGTVLEELVELEDEIGVVLAELLRVDEGLRGGLEELLRLDEGLGRGLDELLRVDDGLAGMIEELPMVEELGRIIEELPMAEDELYGEDDVVDEVLRFGKRLAGCGCSCGCGRLAGPLRLAVGTTMDVWLPSNVGRTGTGSGKL